MGFRVMECLLLDVLKKRNMQQKDYAAKVGITKQYVQKLINNKSKMSIELLYNSCEVLDCKQTDLYNIQKKEE